MHKFWIALNAIKGIGPVKIKQLLSFFKTPEEIFKQKPYALRKTGILNDNSIKQICDEAVLEYAENQLSKARKYNIQILSLDDSKYPSFLNEIFAPPPVLYVKGNISAFSNNSIAIVGMRRPSVYGKNATSVITKELTRENIVVVSGLALGIDSIAHKTVIENNGITIAVLGSGIDRLYPASNSNLAEHIAEKGAVISEFPLGTQPKPYNFPRRNRIISGLTSGTLVIEACEKSGSLITAQYAIQQGRDVFAVPGSIFSEKSNGTFYLIRNGAIPVRSANDILEHIELAQHHIPHEETPTKVTQLPFEFLNIDEKLIIQSLADEPQRLDQISFITKKNINELYSILLNLELKGFVKQISGQQYIKT
ncbi:MAG: DNA-processing protein DprA [Chitinispirillia bacterium]|jgi:DNA processing protein